MSNLIRFEFYNNFDIWYDLYQENGGDPNHIINMMMCVNKNTFSHTNRYGCGYGYGYEYGYKSENGYGRGYGYGNKCGYGYGYECGNADGYKFGNFFKNGNGS